MRLVVLCLLSYALGCGQATRSFQVLVSPSDSGAISVTAKDVDARIGKTPYKVQSVKPLASSHGATAVVVDLNATPRDMQPCLLAEALAALPRIHSDPPPLLIAAGAGQGFTADVDFVSDDHVIIYAGPDVAGLQRACLAGGKSSRQDYGFAAISSLAALVNHFSTADGPARIFWLSGNYRWFDSRAGCPDRIWPHPDLIGACLPPDQNSAARFAKAIGEAGFTVFPFVFGRAGKAPKHHQLTEATYMAEYFGGFATPVEGAAGDTLVRVFEATQRGALMTLEGPVSKESDPKTLSLRIAGSEGAALWKRPLLVNSPGSDPRIPGWPLTPLVLPSTNFQISYGCSGTAGLSIALPPQAPGDLQVYVRYQNEKGLSHQRMQLDRLPDPSTPVCVPLIHAQSGTKFSVVLRDPVSGWVGATDGTLAAVSK